MMASLKPSLGFIILIVIGLLRVESCFSQQELNLHFMDQVIQSNVTNPALFTEDTLVIALPGMAYNYGNNAFTFKNLIKKQSGRNVLDIENVLPKLHKRNVLQNQLNIDLLRIQLRVKKLFFTFLISEKMSIKFNYSKDLIDLLWNGNASRVGETISVGPSIHARYYRELGLGIGTNVNRWILGARIKLLVGLADLDTKNDEVFVYTNPEAYQTMVTTNFVFNTSGEDKFLDKPFSGAMNFNNRGIAADLGVTFEPNTAWKFSASINNFGFIKWKDDISNYRSNASFSYDGLHINNFFEMDTFKTKHLIDTLKSTFLPKVSSYSYRSYQIPRMYLSGRYTINQRYSAGLLLYTEIYRNEEPALNAYLQRRFGRLFSIGVSYSIKNRLYNNWGLSATYTKKKFQAFFVTDNFFNVFNIKDSKNINFRAGINIAFKGN